jgi:nicotinic acid mononucleotide adenylyltransferase/uridine phosphorylase
MSSIRKKFCMQLFILAYGALAVFFVSIGMAASVGVYAGSFDPPTQAQIAIIRCALGDSGLPKECQAVARKISHLVVLVNEDDGKDTLASTRERVLMVKTALRKYSDRIEVVASTPAKREALLKDKNAEQLVQLVDKDSYEALKFSPASQDPRLAWVVFPRRGESNTSPVVVPKKLPSNVTLLSEFKEFEGVSSSAVQKAIKAGEPIEGLVDSGVKKIIEKLGLYQDVSEDLADLQKSLFEEGWRAFLKDLISACPNTISPKVCAGLASQWKAISVVTDERIQRMDPQESSATIRLIYKKSQSEDRWAEKFSQTALRFLQGSENYEKFKSIADDVVTRTFQGFPYGKLPHLKGVSLREKNSPAEPSRVMQRPLACSAPQGTYNADMDQYMTDRFPKALSSFLREQFHKRSILPTDLYVHNQSVEKAYEFHRRDQYATFYFLQTRRGQLHRNIYLAVRRNPLAYRLVLTGVRGIDREANVLCQIHGADLFLDYVSVQSEESQPLFVLNPLGNALLLDRKDLLLFGYKGNVVRMLLAQHWRQQPLVNEGLDIDLFTHPTIQHKIIVARNVYGDDANIILDTFYKKGARQVIYLGAAGAIADYQIGDVVIPNAFVDRDNNSVSFDKNFARSYGSELANLLHVYSDKKQAWVQSLFDETQSVLVDWQAKSVASVDVEGLHLARFAETHPDLKMAALFVISDQTLGDITIEETNAFRGVIDESVGKLLSVLLSKVVNPN